MGGQPHGLSFVDLSRQHERIRPQLDAAFARVVERGSFTLGEEVSGFETEFARFVGVTEAVGVGSGTDALHFALTACGVGPGDEVITVVNTFAATAEAVLMVGARPVFVDIEPDTYLMDVGLLEEAITPRTRAIIPVHLYGQMVDMQRLMPIARRYGLKVIEDACQAHGARRNGSSAGAIGDAGCFSFYPSKNLGALGDGGIVVTNDAELAARVRLLRNHGEDGERRHTELGYCSRLHGLQAALLRAKLPHLEEWNARRGEAAAHYERALVDVGVQRPTIADGASHVFHLYVVQADGRDELRRLLAEAGIGTGIHYLTPLHLEPAFRSAGFGPGDFPIAEAAAERIVSLPMYPYLTADEVEGVARELARCARLCAAC